MPREDDTNWSSNDGVVDNTMYDPVSGWPIVPIEAATAAEEEPLEVSEAIGANESVQEADKKAPAA